MKVPGEDMFQLPQLPEDDAFNRARWAIIPLQHVFVCCIEVFCMYYIAL